MTEKYEEKTRRKTKKISKNRNELQRNKQIYNYTINIFHFIKGKIL